jgi:S1-C subfamily serine protease
LRFIVVLCCAFAWITAASSAAAAPATARRAQPGACGWIGIQVRPMTAAFADSLGMTEVHGAIFKRPARASPAARARIEAGDVITAINGSTLVRSSDFATTIARMAPGSTVHLTTWRNGELIERKLVLGSSACPRRSGGRRSRS